jgi:PAS domain S-box-containing protein
LIVEDSEDDAQLLVRELRRGGYEVNALRVDTAEAFQQALGDGEWDVILCDFVLPTFSGDAALGIVKARELDVPFLFVSGTVGEDVAVAAMKAGAHDYLMKDNLARLVPAVRRELQDAVERRLHRGAEAQLRMSEHKYRHVFRSMSDAALLVAEQTDKIIDANDQAERLFGRTRDELLGQLASALLALPHATGANGDLTAPGGCEATVRREDGTTVPVHVCTSRIELFDRPFLLTLLRDISERKQAEAALRSVLRHARMLVMHGIVTAPDDWDPSVPGWSAADFRWDWRFQDEAAARDVMPLDVPPNGTYADAWNIAKHPDDRGPMAVVATKAFATDAKSWAQEFRCIDRDGRVHWLTQSASIEKNGRGRWRVTTTNTDITERKAVEEALTWRTAFFEAQVDSALDGILVVDRNGTKILQNARMMELWKFPLEIAANHDDRSQMEFATSRTKNPRQFAEKVAYLYEHPDEVSRDIVELVDGTILDRYSSPVRDRTGKYYGRIWTFRDVTEHHRLETQLRQSQKMEAIGRLAGGIAHDFNNLLTVVQMHASLLLAEPREYHSAVPALQQILDAANRGANLTRQLLTFGRRQAKDARPLDLSEVFRLIMQLLQRVLGEQITIDAHLAPGLPFVHADPGMMEQVLMNLVMNARDAMPEGGRLTVRLEQTMLGPEDVAPHAPAKPGKYVRLSVSDTGSGIPPEILPRIFEPFFTTKDVGRGTGLGLATVFSIVQQHGGWIDVATEVGRGTTFHVHLPGIEAPARPRLAGPKPEIRRGVGTILLVEDDAIVRRVAVAGLQQCGYQILEAGSAAEALDRWNAANGAIDLLLTDIVLPSGVSGQMLAEQLQQRRADLEVIYTTGYSPEIVSGKLQVKRGHNYLPKPYSFADLAAIVRRRFDHA